MSKEKINKCLSCGSIDIEIVSEPVEIVLKGVVIVYEDEYCRCKECNDEWMSLGQLDASLARAREEYKRKTGNDC